MTALDPDDDTALPARAPGSGVPAATRPASSPGLPPGGGATTPAQRRWGIRVLLLTAFCFGLGQTVLFAILPPYARQIGLSELQVTMIFGCSAVFWVAMSPVWGRRSDRIGRRPVVLMGLGAFVVGMLLFAGALQVALPGALAPWAAFALLTAARCLHGGVASAGPAASQAYIADRSSAEDRTSAMAGYAAAFGIGTTAGPSLGALGGRLGPVMPLVMVAVTGAAAVVLIWRFVPEATAPREREAAPKLALRDERLRTPLAYGLLSGIVTALQLQFIGFTTIDTLGLGEADGAAATGAVLTAGSAAALFSQLVLVRKLRPSTRRMMRAAPVFVILGFAVIAAASSLPAFVLGVAVSGLGLGMSYPAFNADASLRVERSEQGGAAGLAAAAGASGFIIAPVLGSALYALSPDAPFALGIALAGGMALIAWVRHA